MKDRRKGLIKMNALHGEIAEQQVADFLVCRGYNILERRWRCAYGEIDIIARQAESVLVFVEVKKRSTLIDAKYSFTRKQAQRIARLANAYWSALPVAEQMVDVRFDFCVLDNLGHIEHIIDAWRWEEVN